MIRRRRKGGGSALGAELLFNVSQTSFSHQESILFGKEILAYRYQKTNRGPG